MADYWDEHGANEDEYIEDIFDFIRRLNSGQLPSHWHLEDYADLRLPANVVRMLFDNNPGSQRKTSEWFIEAIEENDSFPVNEDDNCTICLEPLEEYDYLKIFAIKDGKEYGCGHVFHKKCIRKWLEKASACPLCMCQLPVDDNQAELDRIEERYRELQLADEERRKRADNFSSSMFG